MSRHTSRLPFMLVLVLLVVAVVARWRPPAPLLRIADVVWPAGLGAALIALGVTHAARHREQRRWATLWIVLGVAYGLDLLTGLSPNAKMALDLTASIALIAAVLWARSGESSERRMT